MMDGADIFHTAVVESGYDGGRLDTASLHPDAAASLDYVAGRARGFLQSAATAVPEMPPIYFDFIDSWEVNARAFRRDGRYFIGVTRGAVATLGMLFDRMLADPQVLPFIGNPEEEVTDLPLLPDTESDLIQLVSSVPTFPRPRSPLRRGTAGRLAELALDFLTAHEFAHIANGHLDYPQGNQGILAIDEVRGAAGASTNSESALVSQTMEMDADATAVHLTLVSEWGRVTGLLPIPGPEWKDIYSRPGIVTLQWSWAVGLLFRLFGDARLSEGGATLKKHPRPRLRSVMIQQEAERVPIPEGLDTHPAFQGHGEDHKIPTIIAGHRDVEKIFSQLTGQPAATEGIDEAWGEVGKSQMNRLQDHWRTKLKEELREFAHQPLSDYGDSSEEATGEGS